MLSSLGIVGLRVFEHGDQDGQDGQPQVHMSDVSTGLRKVNSYRQSNPFQGKLSSTNRLRHYRRFSAN